MKLFKILFLILGFLFFTQNSLASSRKLRRDTHPVRSALLISMMLGFQNPALAYEDIMGGPGAGSECIFNEDSSLLACVSSGTGPFVAGYSSTGTSSSGKKAYAYLSGNPYSQDNSFSDLAALSSWSETSQENSVQIKSLLAKDNSWFVVGSLGQVKLYIYATVSNMTEGQARDSYSAILDRAGAIGFLNPNIKREVPDSAYELNKHDGEVIADDTNGASEAGLSYLVVGSLLFMGL